MKKILVISAIFIVSCSKSNDTPAIGCLLVTITGSGNFVENYSYNSSGQMIQQIRSNSNSKDTSIYTYKAGNIDEIIGGGSSLKMTYKGDGKIDAVAFTDIKTSALQQTQSFTWYTDSLVINYQNPGAAQPFQVQKLVFSGDNIIEKTFRVYSNGVLIAVDVTQYSNFDTSLNPYYIAYLKRPGFPTLTSKNNPGLTVEMDTNYSGGVITQTSQSSFTSVYTYNTSKIAISEIDSYIGVSLQYSYAYTYDNCN